MMTEHPCAKINLGLNIVSRRPDGYHNLETVFYPVNIRDEIRIESISEDYGKHGSGCRLSIDGINIDGDVQDNLIVKAYNLLKSEFTNLPDISLKLIKNIPTQAGMGGGSADCAFTIKLLNETFKLNMSMADMQALAAKLGADCAFFINPVPSFATGIGEQLCPIDLDLSLYKFAIVKPPVAISTREAFSHVVPHSPEKCCRDIVMQPVGTWKDELFNDFEQSIIPLYPEIDAIKQKLYDMGAVYAAMSGSGSALFGIFNDEPNDLDKVFNNCFTYII